MLRRRLRTRTVVDRAIASSAALLLFAGLVSCRQTGVSGSSDPELVDPGNAIGTPIELGTTLGELNGGTPGNGESPLNCAFINPADECRDRYIFQAPSTEFYTFELDLFGAGERDNDLNVNICEIEATCVSALTPQETLKVSTRNISPYEASTYFLAAGQAVAVEVSAQGTIGSRTYALTLSETSDTGPLQDGPRDDSVDTNLGEGQGEFLDAFVFQAQDAGLYSVMANPQIEFDFDSLIFNAQNSEPANPFTILGTLVSGTSQGAVRGVLTCDAFPARRCNPVLMDANEIMSVEIIASSVAPAFVYPYTVTFAQWISSARIPLKRFDGKVDGQVDGAMNTEDDYFYSPLTRVYEHSTPQGIHALLLEPVEEGALGDLDLTVEDFAGNPILPSITSPSIFDLGNLDEVFIGVLAAAGDPSVVTPYFLSVTPVIAAAVAPVIAVVNGEDLCRPGIPEAPLPPRMCGKQICTCDSPGIFCEEDRVPGCFWDETQLEPNSIVEYALRAELSGEYVITLSDPFAPLPYESNLDLQAYDTRRVLLVESATEDPIEEITIHLEADEIAIIRVTVIEIVPIPRIPGVPARSGRDFKLNVALMMPPAP